MKIVVCYYDTYIFFRFIENKSQSGNQAPMVPLCSSLLSDGWRYCRWAENLEVWRLDRNIYYDYTKYHTGRDNVLFAMQ